MTIPYPDSGIHNLIIRGMTGIGLIFSTQISFSVENHIQIDIPAIEYAGQGYYFGTYGFDDDDDGSHPENWIVTRENPTIEIIPELEGHEKVLRLCDTVCAICGSGPTYNSEIGNSFDGKDYGTIETWINMGRLTYDHDRGYISLRHNNNRILALQMRGGSTPGWLVGGGGIDERINDVPTPIPNTWYHIRIDFEHSTGGYQGLGQNEIFIYINGIRYGSYDFLIDEQVNELYFHTYTWGEDYNVYYDAIGYSWDPNYNIGDNSIDRYLSTGIISEPDHGYYPSTYGFENDQIGSHPQGWTVFDDNYYIRVIRELGGHKNVLRLEDCYSGSGPPYNYKVSNYFSGKDFGTIETWIRINYLLEESDKGQITLSNNENSIFTLQMRGGNTPGWFVKSGGNWDNINGVPTPYPNRWYHIRIDFEHIIGGYQGLGQNEIFVYINGNRYDSYDFCLDEQINEFYLHTDGYGYGYNVYYYAIGYSWDPKYDIGDNLNEGYLCSITPPDGVTIVDYLCKYDNTFKDDLQAITVFPIYDGGSHTLQIFGHASNGRQYCSDPIEYLCDPGGWNPRPLIGAENRAFPEEDDSRLGFIIQTNKLINRWIPQIHFRISQNTSVDLYHIEINVIVNGIIIKSYSEVIIEENGFFEGYVDVEELNICDIGHQIELEIIDINDFDNNVYFLEYLKIGRYLFEENHRNNGVTYTPLQVALGGWEGWQPGRGLVYFNMIPPYVNEEGTTTGSFPFGFNFVFEKLEDTMEPVRPVNEGFDYIHSISTRFKIIDPDGKAYSNNMLRESGHYYTSHSGNRFYSEEINLLLELVSMGIDIVCLMSDLDELLVPINWLLSTIGSVDSEDEDETTEINNGEYEGYWQIGYHRPWWAVLFGGISPNAELSSLSAKYFCQTTPPLNDDNTYKYGSYQVQVSYTITVAEIAHNWPIEARCRYKYYIEGSSYLNFEFIES